MRPPEPTDNDTRGDPDPELQQPPGAKKTRSDTGPGKTPGIRSMRDLPAAATHTR